MKAFMKKNLNYLAVILVPWVVFLLHMFITKTWYQGEGCILAGDAGNLYYTMYMELWEKAHSGGSLFFTWSAGGGSDFLVYLFRYMISPATLLLLLLPKAWLADALQLSMIAKWSLMMFAMLYFVMHTRHNKIKEHRQLTGFLLTMGYGLSNIMIENLSRIGLYDGMILFPVLLLLTEQFRDKKGRLGFYLCLTSCILCSFSVAVSISIFLVFWYFILREPKEQGELRFLWSMVLSYMTAAVVILPCVCVSKSASSSYMKTAILSVTDFIHRWFMLDSKRIAQMGQPMLYCSVTLLALAMLYVFVEENLRRKISILLLALLLVAGTMNEKLNLFWHGFVDTGRDASGFAFLLVFMVIYMAMCVLGRLENLRMSDIIIAGAFGIVCIFNTFFSVSIFEAFYVYLATVLLFVLILMLLYFYRKGSIKHKNIYIVLAVFALLELFVNVNMQFLNYAVFRMDDMCYRREKAVMVDQIELEPGTRVAVPQDVANYNMICHMPGIGGELNYTNRDMKALIRALGLGWSEEAYTLSGASPLMNLMFGIQYGIAYGERNDSPAFSDMDVADKKDTMRLYVSRHSVGAGYMADSTVTQWDTESESPFVVQNDFVRRTAGTDVIFEVIQPKKMQCFSVFSVDPRNKSYGVGPGTHGAEKSYCGIYDAETGYFVYQFKNGYYGDEIKMEFESDGKTDYYVYVKCDSSISNSCVVDGEQIYSDALSAKERTYHIGVVKQGKMIQIVSNAEIDSDDFETRVIQYQVAGFHETNYQKAYEKLSKNTYHIDQWKDDFVSGSVNAEQSGIMMTNIPALSGFFLYVDGEQKEYEKIGNALIGVPLEAGEHKVEFRYRTPGFSKGIIGTIVGLLLGFLSFGLPFLRNGDSGKQEGAV